MNGETVTVAEQKVLYDRAIAQGQPAGDELERQVKNILVQQKCSCRKPRRPRLKTRTPSSRPSKRPSADPRDGPRSGLGQEEPRLRSRLKAPTTVKRRLRRHRIPGPPHSREDGRPGENLTLPHQQVRTSASSPPNSPKTPATRPRGAPRLGRSPLLRSRLRHGFLGSEAR